MPTKPNQTSVEFGPFEFIIPKDSSYFHYIDNISSIHPWNNDLTKIMNELNKIESTIDFTYKLETNKTFFY